MRLQEFQGKQLLSGHGIAIPDGVIAEKANEAATAARQLGPGRVYVKAQCLAGNRAAAGGVRVAHSATEAEAAARALIGRRLVTSQTGPGGEPIRTVLIERGVAAVDELYLALGIDATAAEITVAAARSGGTAVESRLPVTSASPLIKMKLGVSEERAADAIAAFCRKLDLPNEPTDSLCAVIRRLHRAFVQSDASFIEINPLALTEAGTWVAIDVKVALDDNAAFRHPDPSNSRAEDETDPSELKAQHYQINFIHMDGDIGTVVNGAGLGLATLDMVYAAGGAPANFMDIRTTAKSLDIAQGVVLVLHNPRVKVLLVNIFGGGMQPCDTIIEGIGIAFRRHPRKLPLVLRIAGNNEDLARARLANFPLVKIECGDMWQAVTRAVAIARERL